MSGIIQLHSEHNLSFTAADLYEDEFHVEAEGASSVLYMRANIQQKMGVSLSPRGVEGILLNTRS